MKEIKPPFRLSHSSTGARSCQTSDEVFEQIEIILSELDNTGITVIDFNEKNKSRSWEEPPERDFVYNYW